MRYTARAHPVPVLGWTLLLGTLIPLAVFVWTHPHAADDDGAGWRMSPVWGSLGRTAPVLAWSALIGFAVGWPSGAGLALTSRAVRAWAVAILAPAVLCPAYLWAVSLQGWKTILPYPWHPWVDGVRGLSIACGCQNAALVTAISAMTGAWFSRSELESAWLIGGRALVYRLVLAKQFPLALGLSLGGAALILSDPGAPQLMGYHTIASEIHVALAAGDLGRVTGRIGTTMGALGLMLAVPGWLAFSLRGPAGPRTAWNAAAGLEGSELAGWGVRAIYGVVGLAVTLAGGFVLPVWKNPGALLSLRDGVAVLRESWGATFECSSAAGLTCLVVGLPLGYAISRSSSLFRAAIIAQVIFLICPPQVHALGFHRICEWLRTANWPEELQGALVGICSALRFLPVCAVGISFWLGSLPESWGDAAQVAGVPRGRFWVNIVLPVAWRTAIGLALAFGLFSLSDVSSAVVTQPPGWSSYPLRLFALMDNALAAQVSALCLIYWAAALMIAGVILGITATETHQLVLPWKSNSKT